MPYFELLGIKFLFETNFSSLPDVRNCFQSGKKIFLYIFPCQVKEECNQDMKPELIFFGESEQIYV